MVGGRLGGGFAQSPPRASRVRSTALDNDEDEDDEVFFWAPLLRSNSLRAKLLSSDCASVDTSVATRSWGSPRGGAFSRPPEGQRAATPAHSVLEMLAACDPALPGWREAADERGDDDDAHGPLDAERLGVDFVETLRGAAGEIDGTAGAYFRTQRFLSLWHWHIVYAATGFAPASFGRVTVFRAADGDFVRASLSLGFRGALLVLDLPELLVVQRHFLRKRGVHAYLFGADLDEHLLSKLDDEQLAGRVALVPVPQRTVAPPSSTLKPTLFFAVWSLTDKDVAQRDALRGAVKANHTHLLIAFWPAFGTLDNMRWLRAFVQNDLNKTHALVAWRTPLEGIALVSSYLLAVRRDAGAAPCIQCLGCGPHSRDPTF